MRSEPNPLDPSTIEDRRQQLETLRREARLLQLECAEVRIAALAAKQRYALAVARARHTLDSMKAEADRVLAQAGRKHGDGSG